VRINVYRVAVSVVCLGAVLAVPVLVVGSAFTRVCFVVSLAAASSLICRHGRKGSAR
jgi:hypothetical protein